MNLAIATTVYKFWYLFVFLQFSPIGVEYKYNLYENNKKIATIKFNSFDIESSSTNLVFEVITKNKIEKNFVLLENLESYYLFHGIKNESGEQIYEDKNYKIESYYLNNEAKLVFEDGEKIYHNFKNTKQKTIKKLNVDEFEYEIGDNNLKIIATEDMLVESILKTKDKIYVLKQVEN